MNTPSSNIRRQAEELLELSNSMLSAAIGGQWDEMESLDRQRAQVFARVLANETIDEPDRIYLIGAMEHIRVVDRTTREFICWGPSEELSEADADRHAAGCERHG